MKKAFTLLSLAALLGGAWLRAQPANQPAAPNYVLSLGGMPGFLEWLPNDLPPLTESR